MVQVPGLWMTVLGLLQLMVAFPVFKLWFDYRQFVVLQIGTNSQAALLADDEQRLEVGLGAIMEFGPWMLIMVQIRRAQLPFVVARQGNEEHFHRLRLLARETMSEKFWW